MSAYTIGEIVVWLILAAALGFVLGWVAKSLSSRDTPQVATAEAASAASTPAIEVGRLPGSAKPLPGGAAPSEEYVIKGNERSKIYHAPGSPAYDRTVAQVWFTSEAEATAAGFRKPKNA